MSSGARRLRQRFRDAWLGRGAFVRIGLTRRQMARAIARRYLVTFLAVGAVGLSLAMVVMALDS